MKSLTAIGRLIVLSVLFSSLTSTEATWAADPSPAPMNGVNQWDPGDGGKNGSMFQANASVGYLRRCFDYRSIMGEIIRDHLGANDAQLNRIIPGYASEATEHLKSGGIIGSTPIIGEIGLV